MMNLAEQDLLFLERGPQAFLLALAVGYIHDGGQNHCTVVGLDRVQADLDREFAAVFPKRIEIASGTHRP